MQTGCGRMRAEPRSARPAHAKLVTRLTRFGKDLGHRPAKPANHRDVSHLHPTGLALLVLEEAGVNKKPTTARAGLVSYRKQEGRCWRVWQSRRQKDSDKREGQLKGPCFWSPGSTWSYN